MFVPFSPTRSTHKSTHLISYPNIFHQNLTTRQNGFSETSCEHALCTTLSSNASRQHVRHLNNTSVCEAQLHVRVSTTFKQFFGNRISELPYIGKFDNMFFNTSSQYVQVFVAALSNLSPSFVCSVICARNDVAAQSFCFCKRLPFCHITRFVFTLGSYKILSTLPCSKSTYGTWHSKRCFFCGPIFFPSSFLNVPCTNILDSTFSA